MADIAQPLPVTAVSQPLGRLVDPGIRRGAEFVVIPVLAVALSGIVFSIFLFLLGKDPLGFFRAGRARRLRHGILDLRTRW